MLKYKTNQQRIPVGGHNFTEHGLTLKADSVEQLEKKLLEFRLNNNRPAGDPKKDILLHYAKTSPWMVEDTDETDPEIVENRNYKAYRTWIQKTWEFPPKKILQPQEAKDRWEICRNCKFNLPKNWKKTDELKALEQRQFLLKRGITTAKDLGFCSLHRFDIEVASLIAEPRAHSDIQVERPEDLKCWV